MNPLPATPEGDKTPMTDGAQVSGYDVTLKGIAKSYVPIDFARTLERELNEANLSLGAYRIDAAEICAAHDIKGLPMQQMRFIGDQLAALTAERDHFEQLLDEQVKLSADLQGKCGDLMTENAALQQKVEEMTKERDAARQHHKEEAVLALNKLISAETALATATRESERMTHDFQLQAEHDGQRCKELEGKLESLARQNEELNREREKTKELLANPVAVHVMVLRGTIALDSDYIRKSDTHGEYAELRRQLTAALSLVEQLKGRAEKTGEMGIPILEARHAKKAQEIYDIVSEYIGDGCPSDAAIIQAIALELHDYGSSLAKTTENK